MTLFRKELPQALGDIGISRFSWTGIRIAAAYFLPLIAFFPIFSLLTHSAVTVQPNWPWRIVNVALVNGLAEEIMMRGFVFRHLRARRAFWRAAALSTVYFTGYHFPLILTAGVVVGIIGVAIAVPMGFLTAYSYERGSNTIWGPGLLHAVTNGLVMVFAFPGGLQPVASSLYLVVGIAASTLIPLRAYRAGYERLEAQRTPKPAATSA
jgi:membrane protease YdiL (CAAX protease family)